MKRTHPSAAAIFCIFLTAALLVAALSGFALAAEIRPLEIPADQIDPENGTFCLGMKDFEWSENGGSFTAELYLEDQYDGEQILALARGDRVVVNGETWTVAEIVKHTEPGSDEVTAYEVYTQEEFYGYIVFTPLQDGSFIAVEDDWVPVSPAGEVKVTLPLPERFEYVDVIAGEETDPEGEDAFLDALDMFGDSFSPYNTTCVFKDGVPVRIVHSYYPHGPEKEEEPETAEETIPVWKFFHAVSPEGLDTAVITCWITDCETGAVLQEITAEEAETIRELAINGVVTDQANDMSVTGGTWIYTFETPEGKHLLSVEMYKGMLVGPYGMYNYR